MLVAGCCLKISTGRWCIRLRRDGYRRRDAERSLVDRWQIAPQSPAPRRVIIGHQSVLSGKHLPGATRVVTAKPAISLSNVRTRVAPQAMKVQTFPRFPARVFAYMSATNRLSPWPLLFTLKSVLADLSSAAASSKCRLATKGPEHVVESAICRTG